MGRGENADILASLGAARSGSEASLTPPYIQSRIDRAEERFELTEAAQAARKKALLVLSDWPTSWLPVESLIHPMGYPGEDEPPTPEELAPMLQAVERMVLEGQAFSKLRENPSHPGQTQRVFKLSPQSWREFKTHQRVMTPDGPGTVEIPEDSGDGTPLWNVVLDESVMLSGDEAPASEYAPRQIRPLRARDAL